MKVKINVTFAMEFDSSEDGKSATKISYALPDYPKMVATDRMKELATEEVRDLSQALLDRGAFSPENH